MTAPVATVETMVARERRRIKEEVAAVLKQHDQLALKDEEGTREKGAEIVAGGIFRGNREDMYEGFLKEWKQDQLRLDGEFFRLVKADPDRYFLRWLAQRVASTAWLSGQARHWAVENYPDRAMELETALWLPELMWAFRMRQDDDPKIAALAGLWYRSAMADTTRWFKKIVETHSDRMLDDYLYALSDERKMSWVEVRESEAVPEGWRPNWLVLAEAEYGAKLLNLPQAALEKVKQQSAVEFREQWQREVCQRIAGLFLKSKASKMPGAVDTAIGLGWDANMLVAAERLFTRQLFRQKIVISETGGYGYVEFIRWMMGKPELAMDDPAWQGLTAESREEEARKRMDRRRFWFDSNAHRARTIISDDYRMLDSATETAFCEWKAWTAREMNWPETEYENARNWEILEEEIKENLGMTNMTAMGTRKASSERDHRFVFNPLVVHYAMFLVKRQRKLV